MSALLLDTHALLWWLFDDRRLSPRARALVADRANTIFVSSASAWEIATKWRLGKLPGASVLVEDLGGWVVRAGFVELPITIAHAERAGRWASAHRDPFDRMLAAQSVIEEVPLLTNDRALRALGADVVWK